MRSGPRSTAPECHPSASALQAQQRQFLASTPFNQQRNIIAQRAAVEAGVFGANHRLHDVAGQAWMSTVQLLHKVTDPCLLTEYRHGVKICTTFTVSSTTRMAPFMASQACGNQVCTLW